MSRLACLLAAADLAVEPELVRALQSQGVHVVRRCLDAADLLAAASLDVHLPVVLGAGVPRLTHACVQRLQQQERLVIGLGVTPAHDELLRDWGVHEVIPAGEPEQAGQTLAARLSGAAAVTAQGQGPGVWSLAAPEAAPVPAPLRVTSATRPRDAMPQSGAVVTVWGPAGGPGRSTTALAVGVTLGARGHDVLVIDADVHEPSLALLAGLVDDGSGLHRAVRAAAAGTLTPAVLRGLTQPVTHGCAVLSGLLGSGRWRELHPEAFAQVLAIARRSSAFVIVDVAAPEGDPTAVPGLLDDDRQAIASVALQACDAVVAVGRADDLGVARLLGGLGRLRALDVEPAAIALTPSAALDDQGAAVSAVRTCLPGTPVVALPRAAVADVLTARAQRGRVLRRRRRAMGLLQLARAVESASLRVFAR